MIYADRRSALARLLIAALAASAALLLSCKTPPPVITEGMSPPEYFQAAREALSKRNLAAAMDLYKAYMEWFPAADHPQEAERNLWAEYEIAFLYHKLGDDSTAIELLNELIAKYNAEGGDALPPAPGRLAQRVVDELSPMDEGAEAEQQSAG